MSKITSFRKAVNAGRKAVAKVKPISDPLTKTFHIPEPFELEFCLKRLTVKDMQDYQHLQYTWEEDAKDATIVMGPEVALIIVGVVDNKGVRIFEADDAKMLALPANTLVVLNLASKILSGSASDDAGKLAVK